MRFNLHNKKLNIASQNKKFLNYCDSFLKDFFVDNKRKKDVKIDVKVITGGGHREKSSGLQVTYGANVTRCRNRLVVSPPGTGLVCEIQADGEGDIGQILCYPSVGIFKRIWRWVRGRKESRRQLYMTLIRQAVLLPVLADFLKNRGWLTIHGSAVAKNGHALILTGLNGCGKSSFAWHLVREHGYRLLSDNFVLVDPESRMVYGIPEVLRKEESELETSSIGSIDGIKVLGKAFGKYQYTLPSSLTCLKASAHLLASTSIGTEFAFEKEHPERFARWSESVHRYLGETPEYAWPNLYYELETQASLGQIAERVRRRTAEEIDCYDLTLPRADTPSGRYREATHALLKHL